MKRIKRLRGAALLLLAALLLPIPASAETISATGFPDVPADAWYETELLRLRSFTPGIINGIRDADGVLRFHPTDPVRRGEFLKMSMTAAEGYSADTSRDGIHWAGRYYTIAMENNILIPDVYAGSEPMFPCTAEALDQPISRYEMAVILTNACLNMQMEMKVSRAGGMSDLITDYALVAAYAPADGRTEPGGYAEAVEQAYGKGLLTGYADGSFCGENTLTRSEAAVAIYRQLNWRGSRSVPAGVTEPTTLTTATRRGGQSFAQWLQNGHLIDGQPDAEARRLLFGSENKYYFASAEEARPYMTVITVPVWAIDKSGAKYGTMASLSVNKQVADELVLIFNRIYNDPERFPIYAGSVGCTRFSDTLRHSWGCAVDINPYFNCECVFGGDGTQTLTCGYGWWPEYAGDAWVGREASAYHGALEGASPYSIAPGSSVVRAFAAYGWGWGGSGTNDPGNTPSGWDNGTRFDFMHFSVLPSGG